MIFKFLRIRKLVKDGLDNPGNLASEEMRGFSIGLLIIPILVVLGWLAITFILGFTTLLGGPIGFFKLLFVISAVTSTIALILIFEAIKTLSRKAKELINKAKAGTREVNFTETKIEK